jgi:hypothetical protein
MNGADELKPLDWSEMEHGEGGRYLATKTAAMFKKYNMDVTGAFWRKPQFLAQLFSIAAHLQQSDRLDFNELVADWLVCFQVYTDLPWDVPAALTVIGTPTSGVDDATLEFLIQRFQIEMDVAQQRPSGDDDKITTFTELFAQLASTPSSSANTSIFSPPGASDRRL